MDVPDGRLIVGIEYSLQCIAEVYGNLNGNLTFSWNGPGVLPLPVIPSSDPRRSVLTFSPLRLSNGGEYNCSVSVEDFLQAGTPLVATDRAEVIPDFLSKLEHTLQASMYTISTLILSLSLTVPRPRITVRASHSPPFYAGTTLNLTCDIPLNDAVDLPVVTNIRWITRGVVPGTPASSDSVSLSGRSIIFSPLNISDSAIYRCDVLFLMQTSYTIGIEDLNLNVEGIVILAHSTEQNFLLE